MATIPRFNSKVPVTYNYEIANSYEYEASTPKDLVFILIKPLGIAHPELYEKIMDTVAQHGSVEHAQSCIITDKATVEDHYAPSADQHYYPPLVNYLTEQRATYFVLRDQFSIGTREEGFAGYLRSSVISPSDPLKTEPHHLRNLVLQYGLEHMIPVDVPEGECIEGYNIAFDNLVHCSDSPESALREICTWYQDSPSVIQYYSDQFEPTLREMEYAG